MRRLQRKTQKLAGLAPEGSGEKPSHNGQAQRKQQGLTWKLQRVIGKTQLRPSVGEATLTADARCGGIGLPRKKLPSRPLVAREESVPGFKASKGRLTPVGADAAGGLKLQLVRMHHLKILGAPTF